MFGQKKLIVEAKVDEKPDEGVWLTRVIDANNNVYSIIINPGSGQLMFGHGSADLAIVPADQALAIAAKIFQVAEAKGHA